MRRRRPVHTARRKREKSTARNENSKNNEVSKVTVLSALCCKKANTSKSHAANYARSCEIAPVLDWFSKALEAKRQNHFHNKNKVLLPSGVQTTIRFISNAAEWWTEGVHFPVAGTLHLAQANCRSSWFTQPGNYSRVLLRTEGKHYFTLRLTLSKFLG